MPFSKHSMAKASTCPAEMVSRPLRLHMSCSLMMVSRSSQRHSGPKAPMVSYSGLCTSPTGYFPPVTSQMPPQEMGQLAHPYLRV